MNDISSCAKNNKIVIVGMACKLPKADSPEEFWGLLQNGKSVIEQSNRYDKKYAGGFIDDIDNFDASFFNISPREARLMDPQIRQLLEVVYHAIEDSNLTIQELRQLNCGVFTTALPGDYKYLVSKYALEASSNFSFPGNSFSSISGRISYCYNFNGPSVSIDTACSSGLVAIQTACLNLRSNQCDAAIVGGITLFSTDEIFTMINSSLMASPSEKCSPFSKNADGLVASEGCVCFVLMQKSRAMNLGLRIYAEIEAIEVNHDGTSNGFMSPSENSQIKLLQNVYIKNNVDPNKLAYIETHGTGTKVGDAVELKSLQTGLKNILNQNVFLGASKFIVGHSLVCSGLVSTMKAILSFKYNTIPAVSHLQDENFSNLIHFSFNNNSETIADDRELIAINAFGFSGTNAHLVLKRHKYFKDCKDCLAPKNGFMVFPFSAKSIWSLLIKLEDIKKMPTQLQEDQLVYLENVLCKGLNTFKFRIAIIANNIHELTKGVDICIKKIEADSNSFTNQIIITSNSIPSIEKMSSLLAKWVDKGNEEIFAQYQRCYIGNIKIPQYPFKKQSFWIEEENKTFDELRFDKMIVDFLPTEIEIEVKENKSTSKQLRWIRSKNQAHPIILLPPLNSDYKIWAFQIKKLISENFQVHIPIYPYHGSHSMEPSNINFDNMVDELYNYVIYLKNSMNVDSIDVVGWSLGGCLATLAMMKYPAVFRSLCLISTAANFDKNVFDKTIDVQKELNDKLDVFEILYNKKGSINSLIGTGTSMSNLKSFYDFLSNYDIEKNIVEHIVPTLIIHGEKDCVISQKDVDKLSKILSGKKMIISNEGHFIPLTAPKQFNEILLDFIFRIKSKEGNATN